MEVTSERSRLPALDAIRAAALLLGICLHASLSFVPGLGAELWPMSDIHKSRVLSVTVFVIHIFRMSVFFFVAGLLSQALLERQGLAAFCQNRLRRIALPLALSWPICFVLIAAAALWAIARANGGKLPSPLPAGMEESGLNFLHLWFLYLLLWLYAISIGLRAVLHAASPGGAIQRVIDQALSLMVSSYVGPVILAAPVAVALLSIMNWNAGMGVPTPGYTLVPPATPLFIYCYVFTVGWAFDRQRHLLGELSKRCSVNFGLGLAGALYCLNVAGTNTGFVIAGVTPETILYAMAYAVALIAWTFAFVGAGVRYFATPSPVTAYMAEASYWIYIAHLPVVMALQTALMLADVHWSIKYLLINVLSVGFLLITYHFWVRSTWVGRLLNGGR